MTDNRNDIELHLPREMAYTCHNSAVCCNVFETIPAEQRVVDWAGTTDAQMVNSLAGNAADFPLLKRDDSAAGADENFAVNRKACGSCVMLSANNLCAIHSIAGEAAKPQACQDFPWRYVETPGGVYVGLSFVCPSVRGNRGQLVSEQQAGVAARYRAAASVREAPDAIWLNSRRSLVWREYLELEEALTEILSAPGEALPVRLVACCLLPGFVNEMVTESERSGAGPALQISQVLDALRGRRYDVVFRLARKRGPGGRSPRPRRMFLGMLTSFANTLQRSQEQGRVATVARVMSQYVRSAAGLGRLHLKPAKVPVGHGILDEAMLPPFGPVADQITRYLLHCIERKDLVLYGDVNRRMRLLATSAALIAWYAVALAQETDGAPTVSAEDAAMAPQWDEAIGIVERLYGFHSTFYQFFERNRAFSDIVDSFLLKPAFPYILLR